MHGHSLDAGRRLALRCATGDDGRSGSRAGQRPHPAASPLRLPDPEAPLRPLHAGDGLAGVRLRAGGAGAGGGAAVRQLRPRADQRHRLRAGLDPAHHRRADDPHRRHPAAPPRQHGPAGRRHHGDAGPLHHPGLDRPGDAVRRAARLPAAAVRRRAPRDPRLLCRARGHAHRILGQLPQVHRQPAQGLVRRRRHAGERLRLLLAPARGRRLLAAALLRSHGQGRGEGLFPLRAEPRRGRAQRAPAPRGTAQPRLAGGARLVRDRERRVLEETTRAVRRPPTSRPRCSSSRPPPRRRRRAASPTPSGCSSGTTRRSTRWATAAPTPGSSTTSASASSSSTPARPTPGTSRCCTSPGTTTSTSRRGCPTARLSRIEGEPDLEKVLMEINGYRLDETDPRTGRPRLVSGFSELEDDGTTACGCWIYSGVFPEPGRNRARERKLTLQPDPPRVGLRLAAQPPHPLQPRIGRPRGAAVVGAKEAGLVGRGSAPVGRRATSRTSIPSSRRTTARRPAPRG